MVPGRPGSSVWLSGQSADAKGLIEASIREVLPFVIKMADGEQYEVSDRWGVALGKTTAIVVGENDMRHVLSANNDGHQLFGKEIAWAENMPPLPVWWFSSR